MPAGHPPRALAGSSWATLAVLGLSLVLFCADPVRAAAPPLTHSPSSEVDDGDVEDLPHAPATTPPGVEEVEAHVHDIKRAAARIQDVLQDVPLEQTPLGMAAAPST